MTAGFSLLSADRDSGGMLASASLKTTNNSTPDNSISHNYSDGSRMQIKSQKKVRNILLVIIIIIDNRGLNARWCLTPLLLSLPTAAYLGQRGLTPAGLPHTTAQCHLTILGEAVLFCLNHPSFRTPGSLSFCCRSFCRYAQEAQLSLYHFLQ